MATEAARLERKEPTEGRTKTDLTLTGLLMEGVCRLDGVLPFFGHQNPLSLGLKCDRGGKEILHLPGWWYTPAVPKKKRKSAKLTAAQIEIVGQFKDYSHEYALRLLALQMQNGWV
jgi:hypothetical protein